MSATPGIMDRLQTANGINYLNIGLMLISLIAAYLLPFELFLFSYALLGPLHYLTEISWLEKKSFFIQSKKEIWIFVGLALVVALGSIKPETKLDQYIGVFMLSGFLYAVLMLYISKTIYKIVAVALVILVMQGMHLNRFPDTLFIIFGIFLPTIIHVFLFTGSFILYGALKTKSASGIASLLVFVACAVLFFTYQPRLYYADVSEYVRNTYQSFQLVNIAIYKFFGYPDVTIDQATFYTSTAFVSIMRFIAFSYTYHYLNWFSKTSVIKWNQISKSRMAVIVLLWLLSVALFFIDYKLGLYALLALSLIHVFFEFPLNYITFVGIFKEIKALITKK